ncbi:MAG TPA: PDZ domain-containing protein [Gemmatimonadaceae bacterium]|nr:PDZ domain-containing protein [Gemmatimonadaceae bacterium]
MRGRREVFKTRAALQFAAVGIAVCCAFQSRVEAQETRTVKIRQAPPTGWFGVRINDQMMFDERGNAFFDSYPVVTAVDSGSPAARAGVRPGDVLMTFNSHDMRGGSVELAKWLRVGAPFVLKVRRNDATRVIRGTLGRRPENWDTKLTVVLTPTEIIERQTGSISRVPTERVGGMMRVRQRVPAPEPFTVLPPALGYGSVVYPFAGAEFTALNADLSDAMDVKVDGVFVTNVVDGSSARNSGLRGGDIILKANGNKISTPIDLVQAIRSAEEGDRTLALQIMRKHRLQALTLSW